MTGPDRPYWAGLRLAALPQRWADRMVAKWRKHVEALQKKGTTHGAADMWLSRRLSELEAGLRAGIKPSMGDSDLCALAKQEARDHADLQAGVEGEYRNRWAHMPAEMLARCIAWKKRQTARTVMVGRGLLDMWPDGPTMTDAGRLGRLRDETFWRRVFRRVHARTIERCAIALGLVHARADCYASAESRRVHAERQRANAAMLAHTLAVNEHGQEMTLAAVAEKSVANPTIRRGELMTRVAGFEACADALGHVKRWAVITCPSRMHKFTHLDGGKVVENRKYDGTQPREAQAYLAGQWRRLCAHWEREGLRVYGFRTTEPHHDATPHWNVLCFFAPMTERVELKKVCKLPTDAVPVFDAGLKRYFLDNDSPTEPGAAERRVKIKAIDPEQGSAAGYIAKYIAKGVDGFKLETDLYGNPIVEATDAVVTWARVWGIRQFQQIGGPPVTVWRELRRLHPDHMEDRDQTADHLAAAVRAVNLQLVEPGERKALAWQRYTMAQGGPTCRRAAQRVKLYRVERDACNRYGEPAAARVVGVLGLGSVPAPVPAHIAAMGKGGTFRRPAQTVIEAERCEWLIVSKGDSLDAIENHCERLQGLIHAMDARDAAATAARIERIQQRNEVEARLREALPPWTRVNNCTATPTLDTLDRRHMDTGPRMFGPLNRYRRKVGRFFNWQQRAGGPSIEGVGDESLAGT
ncbi:replication endonuclease [uncultured Hydrogenophaga sp.]|uniref:replication endonuclease n=1 Tax=uncultured Hydrogenophaga sp. TaxID=199683 RepID=UPI00265ECE65|nr:replication endonuclease [uncultured Hydrogenophaga sp.]